MSVATPVRREGSGAGARTRFRLPALLARRAGVRLRTRWWVELLTIAWLAWAYDAISNLAHLRLHQALANGRGVLDFERSLHIDPERSLDRWLAHHHTLGTALSAYYDNAHWGFTLALLAWVWWRRADLYRPLRNSLVLVNALSFIVFWRYPVAPPRMLAGFTDVISSNSVGPNFHGGALASNANELAAMPSLHMAWAAWCTLALWRLSSRRWVRGLALAYPFATAFTVIATGNHYVLDLLAGLATLGLALALLPAPHALRLFWLRSLPLRRRLRRALQDGPGELDERVAAPALRAVHRAGAHSARPIQRALHPEIESVSD